jgi:hypothetical protein
VVSRRAFKGKVLTIGDRRHKREERRIMFLIFLCDVLWGMEKDCISFFFVIRIRYKEESRGTGLIPG